VFLGEFVSLNELLQIFGEGMEMGLAPHAEGLFVTVQLGQSKSQSAFVA
jgi:hypothetical protein